MPNTLNFDDFEPVSTVTELRYKNAYLIFDRTGQILQEIRDSFTAITPVVASPQQTTFSSAEGAFYLDIGSCRFTSGFPDRDIEKFARHAKIFFDAVVDHLEIEIFTRIGFRNTLRKEFRNEDEAKAALASIDLVNLRPTKRFKSSESPTEVMFRWEDTQVGASVRFKAETTEVKVNIPTELETQVPKFSKKIIGLTLDVDYYTVPLVEREQWEPKDWLIQKYRIIRKEMNGILQGGKE
jgi:hypothetical protein